MVIKIYYVIGWVQIKYLKILIGNIKNNIENNSFKIGLKKEWEEENTENIKI